MSPSIKFLVTARGMNHEYGSFPENNQNLKKQKLISQWNIVILSKYFFKEKTSQCHTLGHCVIDAILAFQLSIFIKITHELAMPSIDFLVATHIYLFKNFNKKNNNKSIFF